jgi:hypothetical protein
MALIKIVGLNWVTVGLGNKIKNELLMRSI